MSPYERSKKVLTQSGWQVGKTEHWNPFARRRQDLFGFIDLIAIRKSILAVQVTTQNQIHSHITDMTNNIRVVEWLKAGGRVQLHAWKLNKIRLWEARLPNKQVSYSNISLIPEFVEKTLLTLRVK